MSYSINCTCLLTIPFSNNPKQHFQKSSCVIFHSPWSGVSVYEKQTMSSMFSNSASCVVLSHVTPNCPVKYYQIQWELWPMLHTHIRKYTVWERLQILSIVIPQIPGALQSPSLFKLLNLKDDVFLLEHSRCLMDHRIHHFFYKSGNLLFLVRSRALTHL